jgi:hypothetical protein
VAGSRERFWYGVMCGSSQPEVLFHSIVSIWSVVYIQLVFVTYGGVRRGEGVPVNVAPKTRSSGFCRGLGVLVSWMTSLDGSMSRGLVVAAASNLMLYRLTFW